MGKATIVSEYGAGKYQVTINYDHASVTAELERLSNEISTLNGKINDLVTAEENAESYFDDIETARDIAINNYAANPNEFNKELVEEKTAYWNQAQDDYLAAVDATRRARLKKAEKVARSNFLENNIPEEPTVDAWCADYTEGLTGEVGTIEVGREGTTTYIIYPGGTSGEGAAWDEERDGQLKKLSLMTPEAAYLAYALLPGAVTWKPVYRLGEITTLDKEAGTCSVDIDVLFNTHQYIDCNPEDSINCTFDYMACGAYAFDEDVRVVVKFTDQDWDQGVVVGFETEPVMCGTGAMTICFWKDHYPNMKAVWFHEISLITDREWIEERVDDEINTATMYTDIKAVDYDGYAQYLADAYFDFDIENYQYEGSGEWGDALIGDDYTGTMWRIYKNTDASFKFGEPQLDHSEVRELYPVGCAGNTDYIFSVGSHQERFPYLWLYQWWTGYSWLHETYSQEWQIKNHDYYYTVIYKISKATGEETAQRITFERDLRLEVLPDP